MLVYLKKRWQWCLLAPLFMLGEISVDLIQPALMAKIVDDGVLGGNVQIILSLGVRMLLLVVFGGACGVCCGIFANFAAQNVGNDMRKDLFARIMGLSFRQTEQFSTGSLITRITNDVTQVQNLVTLSVRGMIRCSVMFFGGIYMLYLQSPKFALVTVCGLPFMILLIAFFLKKGGPMFAVVQKKLDGINNVMQEDVAGARVVKAYVKEDYELQRFDTANDALCTVNLQVQSLLAFMSPAMNMILNLCVVVIIYVSNVTVRNNGSITTGAIMAAITYVAQILHGVLFFANIFQTFTRAKASFDRINEVLDCQPALVGGTAVPTAHGGSVAFHHVQFTYEAEGGTPVLSDIDLNIRPGETLAILGATGSGKTSLISLIPRFYDPTAGEILLDDINVKDYPLSELRNRIAVVLQRAELYSRPIADNIRMGRQTASQEDIGRAAKIAQADDFIRDIPAGYAAIVSESGHSLSGGQKQRVAVARGILKDAEVLILDDATSALDLKTEASLYASLQAAKPNLTKIIIAQRIASVRNADRIAVLENGRIAACGTHEELLRTSQIYRDICDSQLREDGDAI